jgi:RES domain-containing protein
LYGSATLSLAALEVLVHVKRAYEPLDLVAVEIREIGSGWVSAMRSPVLEVPSAVIPRESNYLLNPAHPRFGGIRVAGRSPFSLDPRLLA